MGQYHSSPLEDGHSKEMRNLKKQLRQVKADMQAQRMANTKLRKDIERRKRTEETLRKELEAVKGQYHSSPLEDGHSRETRNLKKQLRQVKADMRAQRMVNTKLRKDIERRKRTEETLRKELEAVKDANRELETQIQMLQNNHEREKKRLVQRNIELRNTMRSLKIKSTKSKMSEMEMKMSMSHTEEKDVLRTKIEELRQEVQSVEKNLEERSKEVKKHLEDVRFHTKEKRELKKKLEAVKVENGILRTRNEEIQQELEALKARVPRNSLQLASGGCGPQETSGRTQPNVSLDSFHPIRILGEGSFGKVILVKKNGCAERFAIKAMNKSHIISCSSVSYTIAEKEALVLASGHPFITTLYSCFQTKEHVFLVMEYVSGGDMAELLGKVGIFSEKRAQFYTAEITLALEFLHRCGILHRDLKLDNVLIDGDGHCRLADFGVSKLGAFDGHRIEGWGGTARYMAPEMLQGLACGQEGDWWALGIMMYVMMTGTFPYDDPDEYRLKQKVRWFEEVTYPMGISKEAEQIMRGLLTKDPVERLGAYGRPDSVREQPFFRGIDWHALHEKRVKPPQKPKIAKEIEGNVTFEELLKPDVGTLRINQEEFDGFSCINHGVLHQ